MALARERIVANDNAGIDRGAMGTAPLQTGSYACEINSLEKTDGQGHLVVAAGHSDPDHPAAVAFLALMGEVGLSARWQPHDDRGVVALQHKRHIAGMKLALEEDRPALPTGPTPTVLEAIVRQKCISATYNRTRMILGPHILYTRNESLYVDAIVVSREGMLPREPKLGTFKLDGLSDLKLIERDFEASALFESAAEKYAGVTLMAIEPHI